MRHLLNTLFVTSEDAYLSLDGENVVVNRDKKEVARYPLHNLTGILSFSYAGASPALMGACAKRQIQLSFCTPRGKFLARTAGLEGGNVLLRRTQYRIADDETCIERTLRDHRLRVDEAALQNASAAIQELLPKALAETDLQTLRGWEGTGATLYFGVFDERILRNKDTFRFTERSRRPPLDPVNALLSFCYVLLANDCASALESVGLDSYVGFLHRDRPGRTSLALDLMEELRPCVADRLALSMMNNQKIAASDFTKTDSGAVLLTDTGRRKVLKAMQERKQETLTHPYLGEKLPWGLVPYIQALLLARYLRGDLDAYPPFLWK